MAGAAVGVPGSEAGARRAMASARRQRATVRAADQAPGHGSWLIRSEDVQVLPAHQTAVTHDKETHMARDSYRLSVLSGCIGVALLAGCGGGSDNDNDPDPTPGAVVAAQLTGTAAIGAALGNAPVAVTNAAGGSPCTEATITTTPLGSYTCTLKAGETAPFFIVVTDPTGNSPAMVSIASDTPAAGTPLTVNVTPLTTAIVAQLNGGDALGVVADTTRYGAASLAAIKANVLAQIRPVLAAIGVPADYDPFTTRITAATADQTGNTADLVLDVLKITRTAIGTLALATLADPTPVALATATSTGANVAAPATDVADLAKAAQWLAASFNQCFALPVAQRVTQVAGTITAVADVCGRMVTQADAPAGAPAFKHNGYSFSSYFYAQLISEAMTGARFGVPEIMALYPADATRPQALAVMNIKFVDSAGNPGNRITVARLFEGSRTTARPSNWWLSGNQWDIDLSISTNFRRTENFAPNTRSNFRNGMSVFINANSKAPHADAFDSVYLTGPGLPTAGLWYVRSSNSSQLLLSTRRDATPVDGVANPLTPVCSSCSSFWMSRTQGVRGTEATTYRSNPVYSPTNSVQNNYNVLQWAAADGSDGAYNGQTGTRPTKGAVYTFALYRNGVLYKTETRTLLSDLVDATQGIRLQWNGIGAHTAAALDPADTALNGVQTSLQVDWVANPAAEQVRNIWVSQTNGGSENATAFAAGATSVLATPLEGTFTALTGPLVNSGAPYSGYREIGMNYRMLDGSSKQAVYIYNP
jgi:hypothetical protein